MSTRHPIPNDALDDRLGFVGTSGSGKTYAAGTAVERLLHKSARVVIVDPLGVWWGLRLQSDGKTASSFPVAIFGGPRGDLPLTQHAGELIGETAATMAESCIIDLSELGTKSAERRFMTGFLDAIYRKTTGQPFHLIIDEADLFAPQKPPKGDETLLNLTEQIVRRGRVKGFIPWLITQRPAVINKNVLSQVDGLIALKLTSSQDRDALDAWIEGQADKAQGRAIKDGLPALPIGTGVVWLPAHGVLDTKAFPTKSTFDSSRAPKRGERPKETATLKPLDLGALKDRLSKVEAEKKADDPKALRARIAELERQARAAAIAAAKTGHAPDPAAIAKAEEAGYERAKKELAAAAERELQASKVAFLQKLGEAVGPLMTIIKDELQGARAKPELRAQLVFTPTPIARTARAALTQTQSTRFPTRAPQVNSVPEGGFTRPQTRVLQSLAMWRSLGHDDVSREMVAAVAGYSPSSGGFNNLLGSLKTTGAIDYPQPGRVVLLADGVGVPSQQQGIDLLLASLSNPQKKILGALVDRGACSREEVGAATDYSPSSGGFNNLLGSLRTLGIIDYPAPGSVIISDWAQELLAGYAERIAA